MTTIELLSAGILGFVTSACATFVVKKLARLDQPNHRSSHQSPTPTGGGLGIALSVVGVLVFSGAFIDTKYFLVALAVLGLAAISWFDDQHPVSPVTRLFVQFLAATSVLPFLLAIDVNLLWWPCVVLAMVWLINLYNFMDGTDGLAAMQAILYSAGSLILLPEVSEAGTLLLSVAATACIGFLLFNWPPASIFMGDVGSTVIGLLFGFLLVTEFQTLPALAAGLILLAGFITDASWTLAVRGLHRQKVWQAHRSHYYQIMARRAGSHYAPLLTYLFVGILVQLPLAYVALHSVGKQWIFCLAAAITVHALLCVYFKAGRPEDYARKTLEAGPGK